MNNISILGGQMNYPKLNTSLSGKDYDAAKLHLWLHMLKEMKRPKRWLKKSKNGTKVNFEMIKNQDDYDNGLSEAKAYMEQINLFHGFEFVLEKD